MSREISKSVEQVEAELNTFAVEAKSAEVKVDKRKEEKELRIERLPGGGLLRIAYSAGGEVPDELKGRFTQARYAEAALAAYREKQVVG